jgi:hypothetical protein
MRPVTRALLLLVIVSLLASLVPPSAVAQSDPVVPRQRPPRTPPTCRRFPCPPRR